MIYSICLLSVIPIISATGRPVKITGKYWRNSTRAFEAITDFLTSEELGLGLFEFLWQLWKILRKFNDYEKYNFIRISVPTIEVHLQPKTVLPIGETTVFHCRYKPSNRLSPIVKWYHNERELINDEKYMLHPGGDMIIRFVTLSILHIGESVLLYLHTSFVTVD